MACRFLLCTAGTFQNDAKVVNSLFGETWRIAGFEQTNCQLGFERCRTAYLFLGTTKLRKDPILLNFIITLKLDLIFRILLSTFSVHQYIRYQRRTDRYGLWPSAIAVCIRGS